MNQNTQTTLIVLSILVMGAILGGTGVTIYNDYKIEQYNIAYQDGVNATILSVAEQQGNTGNILLIVNNSLEWINIRQLCGAEQ